MYLDELFSSVFPFSTSLGISLSEFMTCLISSILIGLFIAVFYTYKTKYTKSFVMTLVILPSIVCVVIMMVNGNIGTGVATAGAFSLVRFRSVPGTAKEIGAIFLAMGSGLALGMGYVGYALLFVVIVSFTNLLLSMSPFGEASPTQRIMTVTIPEHLDYTSVFDDLLEKYTKTYTLNNVKMTNMGSLFKLTYDVDLLNEKDEKQFIDDLRCRNGNLEIVISKQTNLGMEL